MYLSKLKVFSSVSILLAATMMTACGGGGSSSSTTPDPDPNPNPTPTPTAQELVDSTNKLSGDYSSDITLTAGETYAIDGQVNFLDGTKLTIPAGTTLYGLSQSSYLAINAGAQIDADGTAAEPIIFTSAADVNGTSSRDAQGEWGGLTLIGKAPIIGGTVVYEAGSQVGGGTDPLDNSGTLDYVIIKHTGFEVEADKELNGLSLLAVGSGTSISNVAVLGGADDGVELWGGTVNLSNIYVYNAGDDSIDTDLGYTGTITNAVVRQKIVDKTNYDSSGIENGNDSDSYTSVAGNAGISAEPDQATMPTFRNVTVEAVGGAIYLKNDAGAIFDNVRVTVKPSTVDGQTDTAGQAIVTHRTTDTVDDLSPNGVQILDGGLVLKNEVTPEAIFATETAKDEASGGNRTDAAHTETYWRGVAEIISGDNGLYVSATTLNDGTTAVAAAAMADSAGADAVTGADQSVFGWVMDELEPIVVVSSDITTDTTWSKGTRYALTGEINVTNGAELTIEAGVTVFGQSPSSYLAINKGATINAVGTKEEPIVFTSAEDVAGANGDQIFQGQWGGLTLIGDAPIIGGTSTYEAGSQVGGGNNPADSSGTLKYVVIKNSGFEVEEDKELNGLSLLAVGSGTVIENVAILGGSDDGIEFWGGNVNVNGLYVYNAGDDSIDTDLGYTGTITNAYVKQYTVDKTNFDSSGIENGNDSDSYTSVGGNAGLSTQANQATMPTFVNVTVEAVGGAIYLKNDAGAIFDNVSVITKEAQDHSQSSTPGQAIITHRTTDTVDDLSGAPYGVQILSGGLELINEVVAGDIYAAVTAKDAASGGCNPCAGHIDGYWTSIPGVTVDAALLFESDVAGVTGATIANIWKGKAGSND